VSVVRLEGTPPLATGREDLKQAIREVMAEAKGTGDQR
jgi:uncharacterized protein (UPF0335 family)